MALAQEFLHLRTGRVQTGKDGEHRLLALQYLLVQHIVGLVELYQTGGAEDDHDGVDVVETLLTVVDGDAQMLGGAGGKNVDGIGGGGTGEELGLQLIGHRTVEGGDVQTALAQRVGKHHAGAAGMGHNGEILAGDGRQRKDTAHGGELLAREAAHDAGLAEEGLHSAVAAGDGTGVRRGGTAAALAAAGLDGGDAASLANERSGMEEQLVGIGDVLYIKQFHMRVALGVEMLVHVLQHVFYAYLLAVADAPHGVELQALDYGRLKNEHGGGTAARDEVDTLGVEVGYRLGEHTVVVGIEQTDTVGTYQGGAITLARLQDTVLKLGTLGRLLAESGRNDDEGAHLLLGGEILYRVGAETCRNDQNGQVGGRQLLGVVKHLDALHLVFFGIHHAEHAFVAAADEIAHHGSAGFVHIVGTSDYHNALGG